MKSILLIFGFIAICTNAVANQPRTAFEMADEPLTEIQSILMSANGDANAAVDIIIDKKVRNLLFRLEAIHRVFKKADPAIAQALLVVKGFEDAIGAYKYELDIEEILLEAQLNSKLHNYIQIKKRQQKAVLAQYIKDNGWLGFQTKQSSFIKIRSLWKNSQVPKGKGHIQFVRNFLVKYQDKMQKDLEKNEYDPNEIELGVHELRRDVRWLPLYIQSQYDLFELDLNWNPIRQYEPLIEHYKDSKYARLPEKRFTGPIHIPASLMYAFVKYIDALGAAKDFGIYKEAILHYAHEAGATVDLEKLEFYLLNEFGNLPPKQSAKIVIDELLATNLFKVFSESLDLNWQQSDI